MAEAGQAEVAGRLVLSSKTVGNHIEHILLKLGVRSRAQAIAFAFREHIATRLPADKMRRAGLRLVFLHSSREQLELVRNSRPVALAPAL
jgi:hypothetical protein